MNRQEAYASVGKHRFIKLCISCLFAVIDQLIVLSKKSCGIRVEKPLTVLVYHSVLQTQKGRFGRQLDIAASLATPEDATLKEYPRSKGLCFAVTFDDALQNFKENALPELAKRKIHSTIFAPTAYLGRKNEFVTDKRFKGKESIMTRADLTQLPENIVAIGSHCRTHPRLPVLNRDAVRHELIESRTELEALLKRRVTTIAYPYGAYDDEVLKLTREAGYERAFAALPVAYDGFLMGRIDAAPNDWDLEFRLKVTGAYRWLPFVVQLKQKFKNLLDRKR